MTLNQLESAKQLTGVAETLMITLFGSILNAFPSGQDT